VQNEGWWPLSIDEGRGDKAFCTRCFRFDPGIASCAKRPSRDSASPTSCLCILLAIREVIHMHFGCGTLQGVPFDFPKLTENTPSNAFRLKAALCFGRKKFQKFKLFGILTYFAPNQILWAPSNKLGVSRTCTTYYAPTTPVAKKAASPAPPLRLPVVWQSEVRIVRLIIYIYALSAAILCWTSD